MAGKNLDIFLNLDLSQSLAKSQQIIDAQKAIAREALSAGKAQEQADKAAAASKMAMFTQISSAAAGVALAAARAGTQAIEAGTAHQKALADKFTTTRESLGELANLQGRQATSSFAMEVAQKNIRTGLTPGENLSFESQFRNSGQQYIGPAGNMTDDQAKVYLERSAKLSISRGLTPDVAGDLAGRIIGNRDYKKLGPSEALGTQNRIMAILDAGVGQPGQLAGQYNQLSASQLTPEGIGSFKTEEDVAMAISIASQKSPGRAFTGTQAAIRGLRDFSNPLVQAAGITPKDDFPTAIAKIAPVIQARAKQMGGSMYDALNKTANNPEGFGDDLTAQGIEVQIREGIEKGGYAQRRRVAERAGGAEAVEKRLSEYDTTPRAMARKRAAEGEYVDVKKGIRSEKWTILQAEAMNQLRDEDQIKTTGAEYKEMMGKLITGGILPSQTQMLIDRRARENINARLPKGVPKIREFDTEASGLLGLGGFVSTAETKMAAANEAITGAENAGVNVVQTNAERAKIPAALPSGPDPKFDGR